MKQKVAKVFDKPATQDELLSFSANFQREFGMVIYVRNLRAICQAFPIRYALRPELSWTHYRALSRVDNTQAREWYLAEAVCQHWNSRSLERHIGTLYYQRRL